MPKLDQTIDVIERIKKKTIYQGDCWIFTGKKTGKGYGNIWYNGITIRIGRLICHLYHGADFHKLNWTANHINECTSKACWNPAHLYVGTQFQNVRDSIDKGTFHYGTKNLNVDGSKSHKLGKGRYSAKL